MNRPRRDSRAPFLCGKQIFRPITFTSHDNANDRPCPGSSLCYRALLACAPVVQAGARLEIPRERAGCYTDQYIASLATEDPSGLVNFTVPYEMEGFFRRK